jgi:hypothetical protein
MNKSKSYACHNGGVMRHGQLIGGHANLARAGAPKRLAVPAITPTMRRISTGDISPFHHGVAVMDECNTPVDKTFVGSQVPVHPGMGTKTPQSRGKDGDGFDVLRKAGAMCVDGGCDDKCKSLPSAMQGPVGK